MEISKKPSFKPEMTLNRIEALTDGIFAIAMTLLVLSIDLPDKDLSLSGAPLHKYLLNQLDQFYIYAMSFFIMAVFWIIGHKQSRYFKRTDYRHLWLNILILMFVCLVPYSSSLVSDFGDDWMANLFFNSNVFIIALLYWINWIYGTKHKRLVYKNFDDSIFKTGNIGSKIFLMVSALAIILSLIVPSYAGYSYLLLIIFYNQKRIL
ncbi:MAG: DUF1211 domain-containing protein [Bacteroidales bacterium]|nr:DUF1211 domain-containing protein [Bacteroidales bacterium]MCK4360708.1 DUF1211 domain-containing protein [Bacteroidales bacterium]MCK4406457.1 DUF1211 domain-containing protein [Bacteroidales bacterium]